MCAHINFFLCSFPKPVLWSKNNVCFLHKNGFFPPAPLHILTYLWHLVCMQIYDATVECPSSKDVTSMDFIYLVILFLFLGGGVFRQRPWVTRVSSVVLLVVFGKSVVVPFLRWTLWGSLSICNCTLTGTFHGLRGLCVWPLSITPPRGQPHIIFGRFVSIFSGGRMLLRWELIMAEDSPHITAQCITTF